MEITGPDRIHVSSSVNVTVKGLKTLSVDTLSKEELGNAKLAGCKGVSIGAILKRVRPNLGEGVSGAFVASDGATTDPIELDDLVTGWLLHSDATGAELPASLGGPLRLVYPPDSRVTSICGKSTPLTLKGVLRLELYSAYELRTATVHRELSSAAPALIASMEADHHASLLAFAKVHGAIDQPARVVIAGLDARGYTLRVTSATGIQHDDFLVPFPRPLGSATRDVVAFTEEMSQQCFAKLDVRFKVRSGYYTEPWRMMCRARMRSAGMWGTLLAGMSSIVIAALGVRLVLSRNKQLIRR